MSFPRYPKYKPSGVEWLGEVPEHWDVKPIRKAARLESGHTPSRNHPEYWENCTVPWFTLADVWQIREARRDVVIETKELISELGLANSAARRLPAGTVMLSRTASVGFSAIMGVEMATTQDFANWVCGDELLPKFLLHAFRSMQGEFRRLMMGSTHNTIYMPDIQAFRLALPSRPEQRAIAAFLDRETAKIDTLIAEQEKLIELLAEKRQAVISHAVTKGLNPAAPMKPSGVEWLGDVPAHWDLVRLGYRGSLQNGLSIGGDAFGTGDPFVSYGDVYKNAVLPEVPSGLVLSTPQDQDKYSVEVGDVLFTRTSETTDDIGVASTCLRTIPRATFAGFLIRFRPHREVLVAQYAVYLFRNEAVARHFAGTMNIVTRASLSQGELRSLPICIPPPGEQCTIAAFLDREIAKFDALVDEAEGGIELLRERRSALISAAVTGQIDVRNAVPESAA